MAGATKEAVVQDATIEEIELDASEMNELNRLAEETRKHGLHWRDIKAELGL